MIQVLKGYPFVFAFLECEDEGKVEVAALNSSYLRTSSLNETAGLIGEKVLFLKQHNL